MKKLTTVLSIIMITLALSGTAYAEDDLDVVLDESPAVDYEAICTGADKWISPDDLFAPFVVEQKITDYANIGVLVGSDYIICFDFREDEAKEFNASINFDETEDRVVVYGLKLSILSDNYLALNGNIELNSVNLSGVDGKTLLIQGSDVDIIDSTITSDANGIEITGTEESPLENINLVGVTLIGPEAQEEYDRATATSGIIIQDALVSIYDSTETIEGFDIGVNGAAIIENTTFKNNTIQIEDQDYVISKFGKRLLDEGGYYFMGLAPTQLGEECVGSVEMFVNEVEHTGIQSNATAELSRLEEDEFHCVGTDQISDQSFVQDYIDDPSDETKESLISACELTEDCDCYYNLECIFEFDEVDVDSNARVGFSYEDASGKNYQLSLSKVASLWGVISIIGSGEPLTSSEFEENIEDLAEGSDDGGDNFVGGVEELGGGGDAPTPSGGVGIKAGCSLNPNQSMSTGTAILIMTLLSIPAVVRVKIKKKRK